MRRTLVPTALVIMMAAAGCRGAPAVPAPPAPVGPPSIPDAQPVVDAPLFLGQTAFAAPLGDEADYAPSLATARADGANSGVVDGPAPLGQAPVAGSAALSLQPPLLWGPRGGLTTGCQTKISPAVTKNCLASVDASTLTVQARWVPPGQDLDVATAVVDDDQQVIVTTLQRHLFVVARPDNDASTFTVVRDIDLNPDLAPGQGLLAATADANGNLWFVSGGPVPSGQPSTPAAQPSADTTVGYVTSGGQVVTTSLSGQQVETALAVDQGDLYVATAPATPASTTGEVYDLTAGDDQVQIVWHEPYDAGSAAKPGSAHRGTGSPVLLLGSQYLALTDNADAQSHLLVFLRGPLSQSASHGGAGTTTSTSAGATSTVKPTSPTRSADPRNKSADPPSTIPSTSTTTTTTAQSTGTPGSSTSADPRLVCTVALFSPGSSDVTSPPVAYSSGNTNSVIVANSYALPPPLADPHNDGPANNITSMTGGVTRVDVLADGSGCQTQWSTPVRLQSAPVLSTATGLLYGYTQDPARAATGSYIWYFVALNYGSGRVVWQQRAGAGGTKNDNGEPTFVGANGVLYQTLPLGLVWMRDVNQHP